MTYTLGHVWAGAPFLEHVRARTPPFKHVRARTPPVNKTLSRHDVIWQPTVTIYSDDSCMGDEMPAYYM